MDKEFMGLLMLIFFIVGISITVGYMTYDLYKQQKKKS